MIFLPVAPQALEVTAERLAVGVVHVQQSDVKYVGPGFLLAPATWPHHRQRSAEGMVAKATRCPKHGALLPLVSLSC